LFDGPQVRFELCEYGDIGGSIQAQKGLRQGRLQPLVVICVSDECCCNLDTPFRRFRPICGEADGQLALCGDYFDREPRMMGDDCDAGLRPLRGLVAVEPPDEPPPVRPTTLEDPFSNGGT
jgi:hypothetical protein